MEKRKGIGINNRHEKERQTGLGSLKISEFIEWKSENVSISKKVKERSDGIIKWVFSQKMQKSNYAVIAVMDKSILARCGMGNEFK